MSHMVMFRSAEGKSGYHHADSLDEAIRFVEHLRNQEQVPETRIFRMQEVPIEVKTYYKVEVSPTPASGPAPAGAAPASAEPAVPVPVPAGRASSSSSGGSASPVSSAPQEPVVVDPVPPSNGAAASGARFGRFNRS